MNFISKYYYIAKGIGWDNFFRRSWHVYRIKSGSLRKTLDPKHFSDDAYNQNISITPNEIRRSLEHCFSHFISASRQINQIEIASKVMEEKLLQFCQKALEGEYLFFGHWYGKVGWLPKFNYDPIHKILYEESGKHPIEIAKSGPPRDDVKLAWETSRLSLSYYFARAYVHTGNEKWSTAFWEMFDAWVEQNPPMQTIAWACGQESTFRMMAILFAATVTLQSPAATDERLINVAKYVWHTGQLIERNINYALSQKNNHGISEAIGLITAAYVLQDSLKDARKWKQKGEQYLLNEIKRQIYEDGSFVQHSINYHRVMLDDLLWYFALKKSVNEFSSVNNNILSRFRYATEWLSEFADVQSGYCPNYGANDGAQVLQLSCCDYRDYRPVIQAAWNLCHGKQLFESGNWDEKAFWLTGGKLKNDSNQTFSRSSLFAAPVGGYYIMRGSKSWCMTRCHTYRDRPSKPDMLHFDLWCNGKNIVRNSGTYHYYTTDPVGRLFTSTAAHNTIEIDGQSQMLKIPPYLFLWFYWTKSRVIQFKEINDNESIFEGEHYAYCRLPDKIVHQRTIYRNGDYWNVVDKITSRVASRHQITSRFRLISENWIGTETNDYYCWKIDGFQINVKKRADFSCQLFEGSVSPSEGWESLYYGEKLPVPTLYVSGNVLLSSEPITLEYEFLPE
ncbi:MAG: heparinase II/III family protein [Planctomycetaceae bacterium]|jgi:hypothetical protein|nr:heparinase II/III family protein [Planctomycetaceae bacterium]